MVGRVMRLLPAGDETGRYVTRSYDRIGVGYDEAWTNHMRGLTEELVRRLGPAKGATAVDLGCGTGFATGLLAEMVQGPVIGVDRSAGMLEIARKTYGERCEFIEDDVIAYLRRQPDASFDIVTCCWALGYSRPLAMLRQMGRVLKRGGRAAIIDNSLFSLREVLWCSFLAFAEQPKKLRYLMKMRFLPGPRSLRMAMRMGGMRPVHSASGSKTYFVTSGAEAIARLRATGAAAGFEYAAGEDGDEQVFARFAEILQEKYGTAEGVPIVHRYVEAIGDRR